MSTRSTATCSGDVTHVQLQFEHWRKRRRVGARIPDHLWRAAVDLSHEIGVSRTTQLLRLDYYAMKKHVEAATPPSLNDCGSGSRQQFIELPVAAARSGGMCVLEIEDAGGIRLRMELQGMAAVELGSLVRSVLGAER